MALLIACGFALAATSTLAATNKKAATNNKAATNKKAVPKPAKRTEVVGFYTVRGGAYLKGGLTLRLAVCPSPPFSDVYLISPADCIRSAFPPITPPTTSCESLPVDDAVIE